MRERGGRLGALVLALASSAALALCAGTAQGAAQPYGLNDAGGFRNVLPPGQAGTDNALQFAQFEALGTRPRHWTDQLPLYTGLMYASPQLTDAQLSVYFKDATFGVKPGDVESTQTPRPGVTIQRDGSYGVPHIYGDTRGDVMFGAGYAGAEDRLFMMDVLRHTGRAQLSSFAGGSPGNLAMDRTQWALAPYNETDLQAQIDRAPRLYGSAGVQAVADLNEFVAGINRYIAQTRSDPSKLPAEYAAFQTSPADWKGTDVIATASLIGGIFGKGGGNELRSALALQAFKQRFGRRAGKRVWRDFREKNDSETPTTLARRFPYETTSPFARRGLALPDRGSVKFTQVNTTAVTTPASRAPTAPYGDIGAGLLEARRGGGMSNWLLVSARESATGHPIAVMGPQVGYYNPQILMEEDLHGPGIDARGAAFPGTNLYVQLGHGRDYAWSATTGYSDNVDTFAEVLCRDDYHYLYRGRCRAMEKLTRTNSWSPTAGNMTPAGSETLTAYRTVHGLVYARGTVRHRKVAYVSARTTYMHEGDSIAGFAHLNDPGFVRGPRSFMTAASEINFGFNWSYVDADHIAYYHSGTYPQRAKRTSPDFPILGTGRYDWRGFDPELYTMRTIPFRAHPHATDPRYLVSWNNKQAPRWSAADDKWSFGPVYRNDLLARKVRAAIKGPAKIRIEQLVSAMEESGSQDIRPVKLGRLLLRALGSPSDRKLADAAALLRGWIDRGGHRRDLDRDGHYDDDAAVTLMDAWWPKLAHAEFEPSLGKDAFGRLQEMLPIGNVKGGGGSRPSFSDGWWSYVSKDLRTLFERRKPRGRYSRIYCGRGSRARCREALRDSLAAALGVSRADLYGHASQCADDPEASCHDATRSTSASAISIPAFPWINRPTFQQTVEVEHHARR